MEHERREGGFGRLTPRRDEFPVGGYGQDWGFGRPSMYPRMGGADQKRRCFGIEDEVNHSQGQNPPVYDATLTLKPEIVGREISQLLNGCA